jgi:TonB family protein
MVNFSRASRKSLPKSFKLVLMGSAFFHVAVLFVLGFMGSCKHTTKTMKPRQFIATRLVRLGKPRPPELLPQVVTNMPPLAKAAVVPPVLKKNSAKRVKTKVKPTPSPLQRAKSMTRMNDALNRLRREGVKNDDGALDGSERAGASQVGIAIQGNKYATQIHRCLKRNYNFQGVSQRNVSGRQATLLLRVDSSGKLFGERIVTPSGLEAFDRAVLRSVKRCGKVSRPPDVLRKLLADEGIEIIYTE